MGYRKNSTDCDGKYDIYIEQNTLIKINYNQGQTTSTEYYRLIALFTKH